MDVYWGAEIVTWPPCCCRVVTYMLHAHGAVWGFAHPQSLCLVSVSTAVGVGCLPADVHGGSHTSGHLSVLLESLRLTGRQDAVLHLQAFQAESEVVFSHSPGVNC